jgi:hypothetical protein
MAPIPDPAAHAENSRSPPEDYTRAVSRYTSVVHGLPAWPSPRDPIDIAQRSSNNFPPWVPALEYRPTEDRGLYINYLDPFSVESALRAVGSGAHPGSGSLSNGPVSERPCAFSEANPIGPPEGAWAPVARSPAGQVMSYHSLGGIGAQVETHPPTHAPGRGKHGVHCNGEREEEVALSNGEMNRAE